MRHWLFKSEPDCYSFTDLENAPNQTTSWDGVRNYQARNFMRDDMKRGDLGFFYHSGKQPEIAGIVEIVREGHPDVTAQDPEAGHFDPKATPENPRWYMVDVRLVRRFDPPVPRSLLRFLPEAAGMELMKTGSRLSVQPVEGEAYEAIVRLADDSRQRQGRRQGMSERLHPTSDEEFAALKARVARLERLEEQVYFQEQTLSELNDVITLQQKQLDHYQARLETLEEKLSRTMGTARRRRRRSHGPRRITCSFREGLRKFGGGRGNLSGRRGSAPHSFPPPPAKPPPSLPKTFVLIESLIGRRGLFGKRVPLR